MTRDTFMNVTTNATALNTDVSSGDVILTLDDAVPMWGEGATWDEAMHDLVESIGELLTDLRENRGRLSEHLDRQLRFLERLEWEFKNREGHP
jgi:hypothetical protein